MAKRKASGAARSWKDDETVFAAGCAALERELGTDGMLRFLRIAFKGHDRYEDIRRPLTKLSLGQIKENMEKAGLLEGFKGWRG